MEQSVKCPKCGSTQITANKQGYSIGKAAAGVVLTGGIGLVAGAIGSSVVKITCLSCGNSWDPKTLQKQKDSQLNYIAINSQNEYLKWEKEFYRIYETGDFERAKEHFLQKRMFHIITPDVHQAYIQWKKKDKDKVRLLLKIFVVLFVIIGLFIYWLS